MMRPATIAIHLAAFGLAIGTSAEPALAGADQDPEKRISSLEREVAELRAALHALDQDWLTEQRAAEIKNLVQEVLAGADTRASLLQSTASAGYDDGFFIASSDDSWLLKINLLMQQRAIWNHRDEAPAGTLAVIGYDADRYGFENTRSTLILHGHAASPDWFYRLDVNFGSPSAAGPTDTRAGTLNAYLGHDFGNGFKATIGSMKLPLLREELVEPQYQLAVERSNANYFFTGGFADGLAVSYQSDRLRWVGMVSDGMQTGQTPWALGPPLHAEFALTSRAEFLASGAWSQFKDFTNDSDGQSALLIGAGVHWQKSEFGTSAAAGPFNPELETLTLSGDISWEFGSANLFAAVLWTDFNNLPLPLPGAPFDINPWGFVLQGGFYVAPDWEVFARYEWVDFDGPAVAVLDDLSVLTIGVNRYIARHNAKWTTDVGFSFGTLGVPGPAFGTFISPSMITGFQPDLPPNDGQIVIRTQVQLLF